MKNRRYSFQEYIDNRGKLLNKAPTKTVPSYEGPSPKSPPKGARKGKNWEVKVKDPSATQPYSNASDDWGPVKKEKGGFGDMGDKGLVYEPSEKATADGKKKATWPKGATTEGFLRETKDMSTAQFARHVKKSLNEHCGCEDKKAPHVVAYSIGAFHPDPIQAIKYVTYLANENAHLRRALIREAKRVGCVDKLLGEMLLMPETLTALAEALNGPDGESLERRLQKAIREMHIREEVDKPAHTDDIDLDDADKSELKLDDDDSGLDLDDDDDEDKDDDDGGLNLGGDDDDDDGGLDLGSKKKSGGLNLGGDDDDDDGLDLGSKKKGGGLNLGGDDDDDEHQPPPPPDDDDDGGLDLGNKKGGGLNLGGDDDDDDDDGLDLGSKKKGGLNLDGDDDDHKIKFGDDDDLDLDDDDDDDDLDLDDDDDDDDDDLDLDDDLGEKKPSKMPWEDEE